MRNTDLPKATKKIFRSLVGQAHEQELRGALTDLGQCFDRWQAGEIDSFELSDRIHEFHNGLNREIWLRYNSRLDLDFLVERALQEGLLELKSIPAEILPYISLESSL